MLSGIERLLRGSCRSRPSRRFANHHGPRPGTSSSRRRRDLSRSCQARRSFFGAQHAGASVGGQSALRPRQAGSRPRVCPVDALVRAANAVVWPHIGVGTADIDAGRPRIALGWAHIAFVWSETGDVTAQLAVVEKDMGVARAALDADAAVVASWHSKLPRRARFVR